VRQIAALCPVCGRKGWRVTADWLYYRELPVMLCQYCGHQRGPTASEAVARVREILAQPRGRGDMQGAVWYSKLCAIENVVDAVEEPKP